MKKTTKIIAGITALLMLAVMVPSFIIRVNNERQNNDVVLALNYNDMRVVLNDSDFENLLSKNKEAGVNTAVIGEESINSVIASGYITAIKYNVLSHKYDDESEDIIKLLRNNPKIQNDSYVLITKREASKESLSKWITSKYSKSEYTKTETPLGADVYVIYDGSAEAWQITLGFDEEKFETAKNAGLDIVPAIMVTPHKQTEYIDYLDKLIKKYNIRYINLKENPKTNKNEKIINANCEKICKLIEDNNLTLILTENQDQLSNQKPVGYGDFIDSADGRVIRGYEPMNIKTMKGDSYEFRYYQVLNSVIDRNIRFVNISMLTNGTDSYAEKGERTLKATKLTIDKLNEFGYNTKEFNTQLKDYTVNRKAISCAALVLMALMWLVNIEILAKKRIKVLEILALIGCVFGVLFTLVAPQSIIGLYPSLMALTAPCFSITVVFDYVNKSKEKNSLPMLIIKSVVLTLLLLCVCGFMQASLLSGMDYYINTLIFKGIKISLIGPILYGAIAFAVLRNNSEKPLYERVSKVLNADIKVYWVLLFATVAAVGAIYIMRSGNVSEISPLESIMRNTITEAMSARPRTKEFLVGWPAFVLFVYYMKKTDYPIMQWLLAIGSSILFASVINSFCHVFTGVSIIYMRVLNGLLIGTIVSLGAFIGNLILLKIFHKFKEKR